MPLNEDFQYCLKKLGEPTTYDRPQPAELDAWSGHIPEPLIDFWRIYGWSSFLKGRLWLPNPDDFDPLMEAIFEGDPEIDHKTCHLVAYSAFGDLDIWSEQFRVISINLVQGWVGVAGITGNEPVYDIDRYATFPFSGDAKTGYNAADENGKLLFNRAVKKYGSLEPGECFGFFPARVLGGGGNLDDIQRIKALEHFILLAELQPQILTKWESTTMVPVRPVGG